MEKILGVILSIFALAFVYAGVCLGLILSQSNQQADDSEAFQTILVLGSKIEPDHQPAKVTRERLDAAIKLAQQNPQAKIVVSGARGEGEPEAEASAMKAYLVDHDVAAKRIIKETRARNTYENLRNSKAFISGHTVIVTIDFHIYRSLFLAKQLGYDESETSAYAAKTEITGPFSWVDYYVPEILSLGRTLIFGR